MVRIVPREPCTVCFRVYDPFEGIETCYCEEVTINGKPHASGFTTRLRVLKHVLETLALVSPSLGFRVYDPFEGIETRS